MKMILPDFGNAQWGKAVENWKLSIESVISANLKLAKKKSRLSVDAIADFLNMPRRTFESYLYGESVPPVDVVVEICNFFHYSINTLLEPLISPDNEQVSILRIRSQCKDQQDFLCDQVRHILLPMVMGFVEGFPFLSREQVGRRIRILREDSGLSVPTFAGGINLAPSTLKQIESDQALPGIHTICKICDTLHVTPEYLLAPLLQYLSEEDKLLYSMTPRQLRALSESVARCMIQLK